MLSASTVLPGILYNIEMYIRYRDKVLHRYLKFAPVNLYLSIIQRIGIPVLVLKRLSFGSRKMTHFWPNILENHCVTTLLLLRELVYICKTRIMGDVNLFLIYVKDYADAKFGCVPVAFHFLWHYRPRELSGRDRGVEGGQKLQFTVHWVASFGLRNQDT